MSETATITLRGKTAQLPITEGSEGEVGLDISQLRQATGAVTLDYGFANTGSCESAITFLDGEQGILRYRGYPIEDLAEKSSFLEVSYLLIHGELPTPSQMKEFYRAIQRHSLLHEDMRKFFEAFPHEAHPMAILGSVVGALSTFYQQTDESTDEGLSLSVYRLMGKLPTIASYAYKKSIGQPFVYPRNDLDYCANFFHQMFAVPSEAYPVHPDVARALDVMLILHADHEQNCSTSTVRLVGSSQANLFASISAGISALWGPLHGGANQEVLEMLEAIHRDGGNVKKYVAMAKDKTSTFRLMGFGHRVYKNFDPRAKIIKVHADRVLGLLNRNDPLLHIAQELEEVALKDEYFIERKLYPNVDFYSGIIYRALGIPTNMFTVMFAIGRLPGWIAHWKEMSHSKKTKIGRPRQIYTGAVKREYQPIHKR